MANEPIAVTVAITRVNALQDHLEVVRTRLGEGRLVSAQEEAILAQTKLAELLVWLGTAEGASRARLSGPEP